MLIPLQVNLRFEGHSEAEVQEKKAFLSTAKKKKKRKSNVLPSDNHSTLFIIALPAAINYDDNTLNNVNLWCSMGFDMSDYTHRVLQRVLRLVGGGTYSAVQLLNVSLRIFMLPSHLHLTTRCCTITQSLNLV